MSEKGIPILPAEPKKIRRKTGQHVRAQVELLLVCRDLKILENQKQNMVTRSHGDNNWAFIGVAGGAKVPCDGPIDLAHWEPTNKSAQNRKPTLNLEMYVAQIQISVIAPEPPGSQKKLR